MCYWLSWAICSVFPVESDLPPIKIFLIIAGALAGVILIVVLVKIIVHKKGGSKKEKKASGSAEPDEICETQSFHSDIRPAHRSSVAFTSIDEAAPEASEAQRLAPYDPEVDPPPYEHVTEKNTVQPV